MRVRLAHEPWFNATSDPIKALITAQKPDIFLEATFCSGERFVWLFDAKYRIRDDENSGDRAPDDSINEMHRYRDALIYSHRARDGEERSRPVFGAFVLYPGFFKQSSENTSENPYSAAIREIGIGAFPLVPSQAKDFKNSGSAWLKAFLVQRLGGYQYPERAGPEKLFVEDSARIPVSGMTQMRYPDLAMVVSAAPRSGRSKKYNNSYVDGTATWYHMKFYASERKNIQQHLMREIRHCVIVSYDPNRKIKRAEHVWRVEQVLLVPRCNLTIEQTGAERNSDDLYWLFKLTYSRKLLYPIESFPTRGHHLKLSTLSDVDKAGSFGSIREVYSSLRVAE